jgi:hypothetical protein
MTRSRGNTAATSPDSSDPTSTASSAVSTSDPPPHPAGVYGHPYGRHQWRVRQPWSNPEALADVVENEEHGSHAERGEIGGTGEQQEDQEDRSQIVHDGQREQEDPHRAGQPGGRIRWRRVGSMSLPWSMTE